MADVVHVPERSRFEVREGGDVAVLTYELRDDGDGRAVAFLHTVVPESMGGQGVGGRLAETGIGWAKEQGRTVVPLCPFVRSWLEKNPDALAS
jgi:hypothetical protein